MKANAYDSAYASALAEHAVHAAMAGLTCVSVVPHSGLSLERELRRDVVV